MIPRWRLPIWKLMVGVALFATLLSFCLVPVGRLTEFSRLHRQMYATISGLQPGAPSTISPGEWDWAKDWTVTAYANICFSQDHVSTAEMYRFREDLNRKRKGPIDADTLLWIWDRLAETGPHGRSYVGRFKPQFLDCFSPPNRPAASGPRGGPSAAGRP